MIIAYVLLFSFALNEKMVTAFFFLQCPKFEGKGYFLFTINSIIHIRIIHDIIIRISSSSSSVAVIIVIKVGLFFV